MITNVICACIQSLGARVSTLTQALSQRTYCFQSECVEKLQVPEGVLERYGFNHGGFFALGFCVPAFILMMFTLYEKRNRMQKNKSV